MENQVSRKDFLKKCFGAAGVLLGGAALVSSCNSGSESKPAETVKPPKSMVDQPAATSACNDMSGVAPEEMKKRETLKYVEKSSDPTKHCSICQLYVAPTDGQTCGGCSLFKGPVAADASCLSFAAKVKA